MGKRDPSKGRRTKAPRPSSAKSPSPSDAQLHTPPASSSAPSPSTTSQSPPRLPQPGASDTDSESETTFYPGGMVTDHPFLRYDDTNAMHDKMWLRLVGRTFPTDIAYIGALVFTELWLARRLLPDELWHDVARLVNRRSGIADGASQPGVLNLEAEASILESLWAFLRSINFPDLDGLCLRRGLQIIDHAHKTLIKPFTHLQRQAEQFEDLLAAEARAEGQTKFPSSSVAIVDNPDEHPQTGEPTTWAAVTALTQLVQLTEKCAASCQADCLGVECECPVHVVRKPRTRRQPVRPVLGKQKINPVTNVLPVLRCDMPRPKRSTSKWHNWHFNVSFMHAMDMYYLRDGSGFSTATPAADTQQSILPLVQVPAAEPALDTSPVTTQVGDSQVLAPPQLPSHMRHPGSQSPPPAATQPESEGLSTLISWKASATSATSQQRPGLDQRRAFLALRSGRPSVFPSGRRFPRLTLADTDARQAQLELVSAGVPVALATL